MKERILTREILLKEFVDSSDRLFDLKITRTDSFTGEIGEFIASRYFNLSLANKSTKAYDAKCSKGHKYQIKSKIISDGRFNCRLSNLKYDEFDYLVVVYFDKYYTPLAILKIPSDRIKAEVYNINSLISTKFSQNMHLLKLFDKEQSAIKNFALSYLKLQETGIIRSSRIVGDIGEYFACKRLNLKLCDNKNEKGFDAKSINGLTFEIKTRRVYNSERRVSEKRRINGLINKSADYLIIVTLNHAFDCSGMWIMPMENIINRKSADLKIVNTTIGVKNLEPSKISWLITGDTFISFNDMSEKRKFTTVSNEYNIINDHSQSKIINSSNTNNREYKKMYLLLLLIVGLIILCLAV